MTDEQIKLITTARPKILAKNINEEEIKKLPKLEKLEKLKKKLKEEPNERPRVRFGHLSVGYSPNRPAKAEKNGAKLE